MLTLTRISSHSFVKSHKPRVIYPELVPRRIQTKPKTRITSYVLDKYVAIVKSHESKLKKNFPAAVKIYQVFSIGLRDFKEDTMILFKAFKKVNKCGLVSLSRKELEVYYVLPADMIRVAPVIMIGVGVPFCGFVFVLAYYFPRLLLTSHFWSLQQRSEFAMKDHKKKLQYFKPVFRCMQLQLSSLKGDYLYSSMKKILDSLGSGVHPNAELILSCKCFFEKAPYGLSYLSGSHVVGLLKIHNLHRGWRRKKRLLYTAQFIKKLDEAVIREGGVKALNHTELKWHCFFRGLNPINMRNDEIYNWLSTWLIISKNVDENSYSLLLHCPILLGYNQPSNWRLLHDNRK